MKSERVGDYVREQGSVDGQASKQARERVREQV